jgi:pyrroline-5-carboxylate reductase
VNHFTREARQVRLGFIGTGAITEAMVRGLCGPGGHREPILVSERSRERSDRLAAGFANVAVSADNQAIVDRSDWVIVAVRPDHARDVLSALRFRPTHRVISLVAGLDLPAVTALAKPAGAVHRANPLPAIERGEGPILFHPPDEAVAALLRRVGTPVGVADERQYHVVMCSGALMGAFFELVATTARWTERQGVPPPEAAAYATELFHALAGLAREQDAAALQQLSAGMTAGGLNEQVVRELRKRGWFTAVEEMMGAVLARLNR